MTVDLSAAREAVAEEVRAATAATATYRWRKARQSVPAHPDEG